MADNDDLTGIVPDPPPPDGERRSKAIDAALRRFDEQHGLPQGKDPAAPPPAPTPAPAPAHVNRTRIAVLASAALVMLVSVPVLMNQRGRPGDPPAAFEEQDASPPSRSVTVDLPPGDAANPPLAEAAPSEPQPALVPPPALRAPDAAMPPPSAAPAPPPAPIAANAAEERFAAAEAPAVRAAGVQSAAPARAAAQAEEMADEAGALIVTGSRVSRRDAEKVERPRRPAPTRAQISEWRNCTVDDGRQDARVCAPRDGAAAGATEIARGLALAFGGNDKGALKAFDAAVAKAPGAPAALLNRGLVRQRLGDSDGALADFGKAIRSSPNDARGYYFRSLLLRRSGERDGADEDLAKAIELAGGQGTNRR